MGRTGTPAAIRRGMSSRTVRSISNPSPHQLRSLAEVTHDHILRVVEACDGNQTLAAKVLQIDRKTLYRQLKRNGGVGKVRQHAAPPRQHDAGSRHPITG